MVTPNQCLNKYGAPELEAHMVMWDVPTELEVDVLPNRLYCNKDMVGPLSKAFKNLIDRGFVGPGKELKTFDGCFNIRKQRGATSQSLHSWGIAIDVNAAWNALGATPVLSKGFVQCFKDAGFDWGGDWKSRKDGQHFQLKDI